MKMLSATIICSSILVYWFAYILVDRVMYIIAPIPATTRRITGKEISHITILHDVALYLCPNIVACVSIYRSYLLRARHVGQNGKMIPNPHLD